MTIDEAIKDLQDYDRSHFSSLSQQDIDAIRLGIEALKRLKQHRQDHLFSIVYAPLLGETKD